MLQLLKKLIPVVIRNATDNRMISRSISGFQGFLTSQAGKRRTRNHCRRVENSCYSSFINPRSQPRKINDVAFGYTSKIEPAGQGC